MATCGTKNNMSRTQNTADRGTDDFDIHGGEAIKAEFDLDRLKKPRKLRRKRRTSGNGYYEPDFAQR